MKQPEGFVQHGPHYVCRLHKSLYGLKQSARQWNKKLHATLVSIDFKRLESDRSIYLYRRGNVRIIMPIFIDDITLAGGTDADLDAAVAELSLYFKLCDLGPSTFLLAVQIIRDHSKRQIALSQCQNIVDMLDCFQMSDCAPISTPMDPGGSLTKDMGATSSEDIAFVQQVPYLSAVGNLNYLALTTRPDISYAVGVLARFSANPGVMHWRAVKHLFCYLQGTKDYKLVLGPSDSDELFTTFSDSDHGGCKDSGRSTGGYLIRFGSGAVSWSSKLQPIVALSTTEAEFVAAVEAGKEIVWMRNILLEFGYSITAPSLLRMDNQSAISVSKNPEHQGRMKHLDLRFFWLRDTVEAGIITPLYIPTAEMVADILTKPSARPKLEYFRQLAGIDG